MDEDRALLYGIPSYGMGDWNSRDNVSYYPTSLLRQDRETGSGQKGGLYSEKQVLGNGL